MDDMKDRLSKAADKARSKREQTTKAFRDEMHETIDLDELESLLEDANWVLENDHEDKGEFALMIESFYGKTSLAGFTDYEDHRDDSLEKLKKLTLEAVKNRCMQKGNYYDKNGNPFDTVILKGKSGGWSSYCHFSETGKSFFEWMRS